MTQPTCPACGAPLDVQLTQAGVQPGAPVPQPAPPPIPMPPDANELVSGSRGPVAWTNDGRGWLPVEGDAGP